MHEHSAPLKLGRLTWQCSRLLPETKVLIRLRLEPLYWRYLPVGMGSDAGCSGGSSRTVRLA